MADKNLWTSKREKQEEVEKKQRKFMGTKASKLLEHRI